MGVTDRLWSHCYFRHCYFRHCRLPSLRAWPAISSRQQKDYDLITTQYPLRLEPILFNNPRSCRRVVLYL